MSGRCIACHGTGRYYSALTDHIGPCPICQSQSPPPQQPAAVREEGNVRILGGVTRHDIPVERVIAGAQDAKLTLCIVVGEQEDGSFFFASNKASGPEVLWALERAKHALLQAGGAA